MKPDIGAGWPVLSGRRGTELRHSSRCEYKEALVKGNPQVS